MTFHHNYYSIFNDLALLFFLLAVSALFFFFCSLYYILFYINQFVSRSKKEKICRRNLRWRGTYKACSIHFHFSQFPIFLFLLFSIYFFNNFLLLYLIINIMKFSIFIGFFIIFTSHTHTYICTHKQMDILNTDTRTVKCINSSIKGDPERNRESF